MGADRGGDALMIMKEPLVVIVLMISVSWAAGRELPDLTPGRETRVEYAGMKHKGHYLVYVPKEYDPERSWPVVFCYHGLNQTPKTWPFKNVLQGKGFIVVGMGYHTGGLEGYKFIAKDVENVKDVAATLSKNLNVHKEQMFIGGFSKGGFMASAIERQTADMWAGLAIMGAGIHGGAPDRKEAYEEKAVYLGAGEKETNRASAERAAAVYEKLGASVTLEIYRGLGHAVDAKSKTMRDWFWSNGPLKQAKTDLSAAREARDEKALGRAYRLASSAAGFADSSETGREARELASELEATARAQLKKGRDAQDKEQFLDAVRYFSSVVIAFKGSPFGDEATEKLRILRDRPRTWTSARGKAIEAAFAGLKYGTVYLKMPDGKSVRTTLSRLSKEDQEIARRFAIVASEQR